MHIKISDMREYAPPFKNVIRVHKVWKILRPDKKSDGMLEIDIATNDSD